MINDKYVVVAGTFDMFHVGHLNLLERASKFGKVIALVNTDEFVEKFKGKKPVINESDRFDIVWACKYTEVASMNDNSDLTKTIDVFSGCNIIGVVFGDDYNIEKYRKQTKITREWQQKHNTALIQLPRTDNISSTQIKEVLHKTK